MYGELFLALHPAPMSKNHSVCYTRCAIFGEAGRTYYRVKHAHLIVTDYFHFILQLIYWV